MGVLLGFAPFVLFALLGSVSVSLALWLAFAAAFVITIHDFVESPTLRLLDAGSMVVFGLLAMFAGFVAPTISLESVRFLVELSFFAMLVISLIRRRPASLAYGHDHVPQEIWDTAEFRRANYLLTSAWTLAIGVMALADLAVVIDSRVSPPLDLAIGLGALGLVIAFSVRYPARLDRMMGHQPDQM
jgi:hypothetical protein